MLDPYTHMKKKQKNRKSNDEEGGDKQKKARLIIDNENKTHFSLWVFDCDLQDALVILISLNKHETWSSFILNSCQIWGVERAALSWSAPGAYLQNVTVFEK